MNELITIKQLPVLTEEFKKLGTEIDTKLANINDLVVNEDTYKDVKKIRAEFNKESKSYDMQFKQAEKTILEPWNNVKATYKTNVAEKYKAADQTLKAKINEIENGLKYEKEQEALNYFEELRIKENLDFIKFEDAHLNVTMSISIKKLKEQVDEFINKIVADMELLKTQAHRTEITVEYKKTLDINQSIITVNKRIEAIELQNKKEAEYERQKQEEKEKIENMPVEKPIGEEVPTVEPTIEKEPIIEPIKEYSVSFKVSGTMEELKALASFLKTNNYKYEDLED